MSSVSFRKQHCPDISDSEWADWHWQMANRLRDIRGISRFLKLTTDERSALKQGGRLPFAVTPYYASLLDRLDASQPLRRIVVPATAEREVSEEETTDPLAEETHSPVPGLVHTYPDKVLFLVTDTCPAYCRYCTRARRTGDEESKKGQWEAALAYIREHREVRDVILSGGDPLVLEDDELRQLLSALRGIDHLDIVRIATRAPVYLPQRVTPELVSILKAANPLWFTIHIMHPDELTPETIDVCNRLADAGIPLGSQTVLISGVNDDPDVMKDLFLKLLKCRVRPYYLHQCDTAAGTGHFRTAAAMGCRILRALHGYTTGYAAPMFVIDAPGGGGKVPILPDYVMGRQEDSLLLWNYEGHLYRYPDTKEHEPDGSARLGEMRGSGPSCQTG